VVASLVETTGGSEEVHMRKTLARQSAAARSPPVRSRSKPRVAKARELPRPENLQNILNCSGIATLVIDRDLKLRFFTPAATSLFELTAAVLGRPLSGVTRRFVDGDLLLDIQTVMATSVTLWREVEAHDGAWYNRRLLPYRGANNDIDGVVITFADISEMKAAEWESETARAYSNSIVDAIRQPLVVLDHELRVVSASPSFYRSFAIKPGDAVGRQLPSLRDRCLDVQALRSFLDRIAAGHAVAEDYEIEIDLAPRGRRMLSLNARNIPAVPPEKQKTLLAIDDITDRKHVGAALEAAKKQAERANLGKSRFLAAASHDLRQPLQTIFLMQGILATTVTDPAALKLVTRLGESLEVMSSLLNKLLDINQLEAGIVNPEPSDFSVDALLERLQRDFTYQAEGKGLSCRVVSSHHEIHSDPILLEQMIRNLLSNALKYTDHGKILLGCRRHGDQVRIEVWDTGHGIPEGQLKAIFEEFHQLDNPARERARGLGLGLSIVQRLGDLLGHKVDVRSIPGKGSVFAVEVPCAGATSKERPQPHMEQQVAQLNESRSILIIEDDPAIREMLQLLFDNEGYRTALAADGKSALDLVARGIVQPDIVVADYNLPNKLTGLDVAAHLRESFDNALPVLIVTGDISTDTLKAIAAAGCVQLNKPIRVDTLIRLVRAQLDARRARPQRVPKRPPVAPIDPNTPTIFLIDDDDALREVMREVAEQEGRPVEAFASCEAFLETFRPGRKGCLLVDARLPGLGGIALLQRLKAENHALPSIVITGHGEVSMAVEAMKAGAIDFIEKPVRRDQFLASIERAMELGRDSSTLSAWREAAAARIRALTPRERQIMDLVIIGQPNKNIAVDLNVSQRTVENHRAAVMKKTGSKSLSDLVRLAIAAV
jgi:two-component system, chemotaxis family, CheB/CheR fusion protein